MKFQKTLQHYIFLNASQQAHATVKKKSV